MTSAALNNDSSRRGRGVILMLCAGLMWSIAGVATRHVEQAGRWEITGWRSLSCAIAMLAIMLALHRRDTIKVVAGLGRVGLLSGALWALMFTCFMLALTQTTTANTLILTSISPLTASLFAWLLIREPITARTWGLILLALSGIAIMFGGEAGQGRLAGNLIALLVPLAAGLNFTLIRKSGARVDLAPAILVGGTLSALATLPLAWPFHASGQDLAILAVLGAFQLAVPCTLMVMATRYLSVAEVALLGLSENLFGPLWAWLGAGEMPSRQALIGGALVLAALLFEALSRGSASKNPPVVDSPAT